MTASRSSLPPTPDHPTRRAIAGPAGRRLARTALVLALVTALAVPLATGQPGGPDPAPIAARLPPLPAEDGRVELPLDESPVFRWVAIDGGSGISHPEGALRARYAIDAGTPAGAALIVRAGTLAGLRALEIEIRGDRPTRLVPTLRDTAGVVYRFPAVAVRPGGPRTQRLSVDDLSYFPGQAEAPDPGSVDPAGTILLSLVDVSGFTGELPAGTEVEWTVSRLTGVVGEAPSPAAVEDAPAAVAPKAEPPEAAAERHPLAVRAEVRFFEILNHRPQDRSAALGDLMAAYAADPDDARTNLWLGLNHLWLAAEGDRTDPRVIENLILAERFLDRARKLDPGDGRIPSWLVPTRRALARIERAPERTRGLDAELAAAYEEIRASTPSRSPWPASRPPATPPPSPAGWPRSAAPTPAAPKAIRAARTARAGRTTSRASSPSPPTTSSRPASATPRRRSSSGCARCPATAPGRSTTRSRTGSRTSTSTPTSTPTPIRPTIPRPWSSATARARCATSTEVSRIDLRPAAGAPRAG